MAMHLVLVAAIHLSRAGTGAGMGAGMISPGIAGNLIWPYILKICLSVKLSPQDLVSSSRFLLFQIAQIFTSSTPNGNNNTNNDNNNSNNRWDRAVRLVRERVALARDSRGSLHHGDEESLHILSMLAL